MNQHEHNMLSVMAGGWEIRAAEEQDEGAKRAFKSNAAELRLFLQYADTAPPPPLPQADGEPERLPP